MAPTLLSSICDLLGKALNFNGVVSARRIEDGITVEEKDDNSSILSIIIAVHDKDQKDCDKEYSIEDSFISLLKMDKNKAVKDSLSDFILQVSTISNVKKNKEFFNKVDDSLLEERGMNNIKESTFVPRQQEEEELKPSASTASSASEKENTPTKSTNVNNESRKVTNVKTKSNEQNNLDSMDIDDEDIDDEDIGGVGIKDKGGDSKGGATPKKSLSGAQTITSVGDADKNMHSSVSGGASTNTSAGDTVTVGDNSTAVVLSAAKPNTTQPPNRVTTSTTWMKDDADKSPPSYENEMTMSSAAKQPQTKPVGTKLSKKKYEEWNMKNKTTTNNPTAVVSSAPEPPPAKAVNSSAAVSSAPKPPPAKAVNSSAAVSSAPEPPPAKAVNSSAAVLSDNKTNNTTSTASKSQSQKKRNMPSGESSSNKKTNTAYRPSKRVKKRSGGVVAKGDANFRDAIILNGVDDWGAVADHVGKGEQACKNHWEKLHPTTKKDFLRMHDEILQEDMIEIE